MVPRRAGLTTVVAVTTSDDAAAAATVAEAVARKSARARPRRRIEEGMLLGLIGVACLGIERLNWVKLLMMHRVCKGHGHGGREMDGFGGELEMRRQARTEIEIPSYRGNRGFERLQFTASSHQEMPASKSCPADALSCAGRAGLPSCAWFVVLGCSARSKATGS